MVMYFKKPYFSLSVLMIASMKAQAIASEERLAVIVISVVSALLKISEFLIFDIRVHVVQGG